MDFLTTDRTPRWLIYTSTAVLGIAFASTLFFIAWSNAIDERKKEFSYELTSLKQTIAHNVLVSNNVINDLAAYIDSNPELSLQQFQSYASSLLGYYPFIGNIAYYPLVTDEHGNYKLPLWHEEFRNKNIFTPGQDITVDNRLDMIVSNLLSSETSPVISSAFQSGQDLYYGVYRVIFNSKTTDTYKKASLPDIRGIVSIFTSPEKFFGHITLPDDISLTLYSEYASIGRQLLFKKEAGSQPGKGLLLSPIMENHLIQLPASSIKLEIAKNIYWQDIEKGLIYTALMVGLGVTLLLVALIRAKDEQARVLRERNVVIERKVNEQTHELALARDEAVAASRMKSEFLASMSHEIRTPLNAIIGMSELMSETKLSDEQEKYINIFRRAGDTLLSLVNDILDLSKIEAHQLIIESISISVLEVVEESVEIYALKAAEKKIELVSHVDPDLNIYRLGDPVRLRQILLNLISNALKFTGQGEIVVNVTVDNNSGDPEQVLFTVRDTGIGIPQDKLSAIFESFTQADSSTTRKYGGTGLGLTISRSLVELMHGRIWVDSEPDKGSTFSLLLHLPIDQKDSAKHVKPYREIMDKRILLVCENATIRKIINEILKARGAVITQAENVSQAKTTIEKSADKRFFDLVIVDYYLSDMQGFELVSDLKSHGHGMSFVMMISPAELNDGMKKIKEYGINSYLVKPVKQYELLETVHNCFVTQEERIKIHEQVTDNETRGFGKKILLVDDNQDNRMLFKAYLKKTAYEIDEAEDGQIAVDKFQSGIYDVVFMDMQMPVLDGYGATRAIRTWETGNSRTATPIIALTAHASREEIDKCIAAGCNSHLAKPVKKSTLLETLTAHSSRP